MSVNWNRMLEKYNGVGSTLIPDDIRKDVLGLIRYARVSHQENLKLVAGFAGAKQTVMALCIQAGGTLDVAYDLIDQIKPSDKLDAIELLLPGPDGGPPIKVKRFRIGSKSLVRAVPSVN